MRDEDIIETTGFMTPDGASFRNRDDAVEHLIEVQLIEALESFGLDAAPDVATHLLAGDAGMVRKLMTALEDLL